MRPMIPALVAAGMLFAMPASAAPTCQDEDGQTVRCGTPTAMPVGWTQPADQQEHQVSTPPPTGEIIALVCLVGGFLALIALMPDFDGPRHGGWDKQEDDDEEAD